MQNSERYFQAKKITLIGAIINFLLGIIKLIGGYFFHSHALVADGFHSFSDLITILTSNITQFPTTFFTNSSGYDFEPYITFPNKQNTFDIKEEAKMGLVSPPKINNELFIERQDLAVFERYSRFSEIKNLNDLIYYRNGYYNIKQTV